MKPFELLTTPLSGRNLIEANAGTGKTYAISGLFLRLIVELDLPVSEILVMTYTVAATEELKERIRGMLRQALVAVQSGKAEGPFLVAFLELLSAKGRTNSARRRLTAALRDFDEASIFTIHGFCRRILQENAFESSSTFDAELIAEQSEITDTLLQDFWRGHFYEAPPELAAYALSTGKDLDGYRAFLRQALNRPDIRIVPEIAAPDRGALDREIDDYRRAMSDLRKEWGVSRESIRRALQDGALKANSYGGAKTDSLIEELDAFLGSGALLFPLPNIFEKFTSGKLAASCKKDCLPPKHTFFESCQQLLEQEQNLKGMMDGFLISMKKELLETVRAELPVYKARRNILFFDDLLLRLRDALRQPKGDLLAGAIRRKCRAALIDEFQDTDPVQYDILNSVFLRNDSDELPPVFLIGDPKQAIYSFRGADIFAYMAAARQVDVSYTLKENWRSAPALLDAVNCIFHEHPNPFVYDAISFADSGAAPVEKREELTISCTDKAEEAPLQLWVIPPEENGKAKPVAKNRATFLILQAVTAEISRLLEAGKEGKALISGRALEAGDVAVLVRSNREALLVQQALSEIRIPAVLHSRENLFDSPDAEDMELLLRAIETPGDERRLGAVLLSPLFGVSIGELYRIKNDDRQWEERLFRFQEYHDLWQKTGFMRMMRFLLRREDVRARLLLRPDGERRLTNVLHLTEVLHRESTERNRGMRGLVRWLAMQRNSNKERSDEHQLRLESDAHAVRVVTIHKSKGLEYPVVFCPFVWEGAGDLRRSNEIICHGGGENEILLCDIGLPPDPSNRQRAYREGLAERVRLLYVALTRAKHRCYLIWGHFNEAEDSAPAYLFHGRDRKWNEDAPDVAVVPEDGGQKSYKALTKAEFLCDLERMASSGAISISNLPLLPASRTFEKAAAMESLSCRDFNREIDQTWRFTSFSSLVFGQYLPTERIDREVEVEGGQPQISDWRNLPAGTSTGNMLHEFLERLDFKEKDEAILRQRARETLSAYGFDSRWETALLTLADNILSVPLQLVESGKSLYLSDLGWNERISELGFYFPLKKLTREKLSALFRDLAREDYGSIPEKWEEEVGRLSFNPVRGWLRGFIDLVFIAEGRYYLADWKSNFLGTEPEAYLPEALKAVMVNKHYILQYHLYALALHAYLKRRIPDYSVEKHFGGIYYFFIRGIDPARGMESGIYFDRPSEARLNLLYESLIEKNPVKTRKSDASN